MYFFYWNTLVNYITNYFYDFFYSFAETCIKNILAERSKPNKLRLNIGMPDFKCDNNRLLNETSHLILGRPFMVILTAISTHYQWDQIR